MLLSMLFSVLALAAPAKETSVEKLLVVTKAEKMSDSIGERLDKMKAQLKDSLAAGKKVADPKLKAMDKEIEDLVQAFKKENVSFAHFKADIVKIYQEAWSEEEVQDLIRFYETSTGKKSIETAPAMMQKTMELVQSRLQSKLPAFQQEVKAIVDKHMPEPKGKK